MKRTLVTIVSIILAAQASIAGELALQWVDLDRGAQYSVFSGELFGQKRCISILRYPASSFRTDVINDPAFDAAATSTMAKRHGAYAAINASYFNVKQLTPVTYVKEDKVQEGHTTAYELFRTDGIVSINAHKIRFDYSDTLSYAALSKGYEDAIASGPLLLKDGKGNPEPYPAESFFTKSHPRTIIGATKGHKWIYFIIIDGRFELSVGMSVDEEVELCRMLGLSDALNLDGGGSSTMWIDGIGVINHPYDNKKYDHDGKRRVPNIIIIR